MLISIVRYLEKSKDKALPETHNVMELIVKTFKSINKDGLDDATIVGKKNTAYNKVMDLKGKIAKVKADPDAVQKTETQYEDVAVTVQSKVEPVAAEPVQNSQIIVTILSRLELCENRLAAMEAQNITLQQKVYELTHLNHAMNNQISDLGLKFSSQINELAQTVSSLPASSGIGHDVDMEYTDADDEVGQYDDISFDGLDFEDMASDADQVQKTSALEMNLKEVPLDEIAFDEMELDEMQFDGTAPAASGLDSETGTGQDNRLEIDFDKLGSDAIGFEQEIDSIASFEEITTDDIEYDEITSDDLQFDDNLISGAPDGQTGRLETDSVENKDNSDVSSVEDTKEPERAVRSSEDASVSALNIDAVDYISVRCFKIDDQIVAFPDDKIYNIYKIPSRLLKNISQTQTLVLGEFSSFFQNLSKNMKGHLSGVSNSTLKQMNVDVHLLTNQEIQYKRAVLCSFDGRVSIVPVTEVYDDRTHPFTGLKEGQNSFSDYSTQIFDIGTIPFVTLSKK
ncbi:MAG: hypothetical protein HQK61_07165 [Desulfamplus sp.]|nr:hypothetical protein [Desulfamplus sp.]